MNETQATVHRWIDETFPGADPGSARPILRALEEMVELCIAAGATPHEVDCAVVRSLNSAAEWQPRKASDPQPEKVPAEAADVLIVLYGVAGMRGFDLHAEVNRKMAINRARRWKANGDGTGYHIREEENGE